MAKKQKTQEVEVPVVETPVVATPKPKKVETKKPTWEIKDRVYYLKSKQKHLSYMLKSSNVYYFDEEKGYERELKYCENQKQFYKNYFLYITRIKIKYITNIILFKKQLTK